MTLKLYELSPAIKTLLALMEEEAEGWDAALAELEGAFQEKAVNLAKLCKTWEAEERAYKDEITRLQGHMSGARNRRNWAMDYLKRNMEEAGIDHIEDVLVDIRLQNSPPSVTLIMGDEVHNRFLKGTLILPWARVLALGLLGEGVTLSVDKRAILDEFKATGVVPAGVTIEQGRHVRLR